VIKDSEDMSIFGTTDGDAALLAISILLQGNLSEGKFVERLADFNLGFKETGTWDNKTEKESMADWAVSGSTIATGDFCKYDPTSEYLGDSNCWRMPTDDMCENGTLVKNCSDPLGANFAKIRKNILDWSLSSSVPDFEKFANNYWKAYYFGEVCDAKKAGEIKNGPSGTKVICKNNDWVTATDYEILLGLCSKEGEVKEGQCGKEYVCRNGNWLRQQKQQMKTCDGSLCTGPVTLKINECVEINVLGYTQEHSLPKVGMYCTVEDTQNDVSVTLSLDGKSTDGNITDGQGIVVQLGQIKLGDNEFCPLCLTAISGATSIECLGPYSL